jgi:hypothetical protein
LTKLASLACALRQRGVEEPAASLAAQTGMAIAQDCFRSLRKDTTRLTLAEIICTSADELKVLTAQRRAAARR